MLFSKVTLFKKTFHLRELLKFHFINKLINETNNVFTKRLVSLRFLTTSFSLIELIRYIKTYYLLNSAIALVVFFALFSCATYNNSSYFTDSSNKTIQQQFNPNFVLVQLPNDSVEIHFEIALNELLFSNKGGGSYRTRLYFFWKIFETAEGKTLQQQDSTILTIPKPENNASHVYSSFKLKLPTSNSCFLALRTTDINRRSNHYYNTPIYKGTAKKYSQYFFIKRDNETPLVKPYCSTDEAIRVTAPNLNSRKLYVFEIEPTNQIAKEPYNTTAYSSLVKLKNVRIILEDPVYKEYRFKMNKTQITLLTGDTINPEGYCLFQFPKGYPKLSNYKDLINSLAYISTKTELSQLQFSKNKRADFEKFWESLAGNQERAKTLIKQYHSRVEKANTYFTSYKEGWKTDRGMILIIFGQPENISRNAKYETWSYGKGDNTVLLSFTFEKIPNRLSNNDYVLIRNANYRTIWNTAISTWRSGRYFIF